MGREGFRGGVTDEMEWVGKGSGEGLYEMEWVGKGSG